MKFDQQSLFRITVYLINKTILQFINLMGHSFFYGKYATKTGESIKISRILFYSIDLIPDLQYYIRKSRKVIVMITVYRINETILQFIYMAGHFFPKANMFQKQKK